MYTHRSLAVLILAPFVLDAFATHVIGGEIRYTHLSITTYSIEVVTWCDLTSPADRPEILVDFGDGVVDTVPRTSILDDPFGGSCGSLRLNTYTTTHAFQGSGTYIIRHTDANRNGGIINVPNSASQAFSVSVTLVISPAIAGNNSVQFDIQQIEPTWNWSTLVVEPQAMDPDSDSLVFQLVIPEGLEGDPISGYQFPEDFTSGGGYAWCDPTNGRFLWDHPTLIGEYVIAIRCDEWRDGVLVGQATRDMTICVSTVATLAPDDSVPIEDLQVFRSQDDWMVENNATATMLARLIDARGALVRMISLAPGRTVVSWNDHSSGMMLLLATDAEGRHRAYKLVRP